MSCKSKFLYFSLAFSVLFNNNIACAELTSLDDLQNLSNNQTYFNVDADKPIDKNHWAYKTLENISSKHGLLVGNSKEKFDINKPLTRNEAAVMLISLMGRIQQDRVELSEAEKIQLDILRQELQGEMARLTGRVEQLEGSVSKLESSVNKLNEADKKNIKISDGENFKLNGYSQFKFASNVNRGSDNYASNMTIPFVELRVSGKLHKDLNYIASMIPTRSFNSAANTVLSDTYLYTDKFKNNRIIFGHTRIPVGQEGAASALVIDTMDRSQIARKFSDFRDFGVKVIGKYSFVDYYLGTFNGNGLNRSDQTNKDMSYGGWVVLKPLYKYPKLGKLELGGGTYSGKFSYYANNVFQRDVDETNNGLYAAYEYKRNKISGEWGEKKGYNHISGQKADGWYIQDTLFLDKKRKHQILAKYDTFDPNKSASNDQTNEYTLGYNYFIKGHMMKLQFNAVHVDNKVGKDSDRLMFLTQYCF